MIPRWCHRIYAALMGYFWMPCHRCGRMFGGHEESGGVDWKEDRPADPVSRSGYATCPHCPGDKYPDGRIVHPRRVGVG